MSVYLRHAQSDDKLGEPLVQGDELGVAVRRRHLGKCMACAWHVYGMCMARAWHVRGMCMARAWHVRGMCICMACTFSPSRIACTVKLAKRLPREVASSMIWWR